MQVDMQFQFIFIFFAHVNELSQGSEFWKKFAKLRVTFANCWKWESLKVGSWQKFDAKKKNDDDDCKIRTTSPQQPSGA